MVFRLHACAVIVRFRFIDIIIISSNKSSPIGTPEHLYPTLPLPRFPREGSTPRTSTFVRGQTPQDITDLPGVYSRQALFFEIRFLFVTYYLVPGMYFSGVTNNAIRQHPSPAYSYLLILRAF